MNLNLIVACDLEWNIGRGEELLFRISEDLKRFKALTTGHPVIYGRRTLASFPKGKPLAGRPNLVFSRNPDYTCSGATMVRSLETLAAELERLGDPEPFVIGGGTIYRQLLPYCRTAYVTRVLSVIPGDVRIPDLDHQRDWFLAETGPVKTVDGLTYRYDCYRNRHPLPLP